MTKQCSCCRETKGIDEFNKDSSRFDSHGRYCKTCATTKAKAFYHRHNERQAAHRTRRKYRLTDAEMAHWEKNREGLCEMCGNHETHILNGRRKRLSVDHCHITGAFRGLLCYTCNTVGRPDDIELLKLRIAYLEKHNARHQRSALSSVA